MQGSGLPLGLGFRVWGFERVGLKAEGLQGLEGLESLRVRPWDFGFRASGAGRVYRVCRVKGARLRGPKVEILAKLSPEPGLGFRV